MIRWFNAVANAREKWLQRRIELHRQWCARCITKTPCRRLAELVGKLPKRRTP